MIRLRLIMLLTGVAVAVTVAGRDTRQQIVHPMFSALQVQLEGNAYAPAIMTIGTSDRIVIKFDERASDRRYMRYELIHCNADWQQSRLLEVEYLDGFNEAPVDDYAFSRLTETLYVHYTITLPNSDMQFKTSGNYLVRVYDEGDPDATLLQARFYVAERTADVGASVTSRTDIDFNDAHQQLTVTANTERIGKLGDMFSEFTLVAEQNGRQDNMAVVRTPLRVDGRNLVYEHKRELIFPAGNEYRRFENINARYPGMGVHDVKYMGPFYHYNLYTDLPRAEHAYSFDRTQYGRFTPRNYDYNDGDTEADYGIVHFALEMPRRTDGNIYIEGDLTQRNFSPENRMVYNDETGCYESSLLLKQGSYNYQYVFVPDGSTSGRTADIEGNKYQTVNEYVVRLYHRPLGARADRLVGYALTFAGQ